MAQQISVCHENAARFGFSPENIEVYDEDEGEKGEWWWHDSQERNPKPWRPELTRLMRDIDAGKIDVVMVWNTDRLYRDAGVCDALMKTFKAKGVKFIAGHHDMDVDSAAGFYRATLDAAANRKWRDTISEDVRRDHDDKAKLGMFSRNPSCLGFRSKGRGSQEVEPIWEEIELINRIFRLFITGEGDKGPLGINAICNLLMNEGISLARGAKGHKPKNPERVHTSQIKTILTNCMYVAIWRHRGQHYECKRLLVPSRDGSGAVETVVPVSLFAAAQEKIRLTDRPGRRSLADEHMLSGLVVCAYCGRPMHINYRCYKDKDGMDTRPPRRTYICRHTRPPRYCEPFGRRSIQESVVDEWVMRELAPILGFEIKEMRTAAGRDADIQTLAETARNMEELQRKETETLVGMVGVLDREQITQVAGKFRADREQLQRKSDEIRARLAAQDVVAPDVSFEGLADMPKSAVKDAVRRAVEWIAIGKDGVTVLTRWGSYIGATFREMAKGTYFTSETKTLINPPSPAETLQSTQWLPSPADFVRGRRDYMGRRGEKLTDGEILPNVFYTEECVDDITIDYLEFKS